MTPAWRPSDGAARARLFLRRIVELAEHAGRAVMKIYAREELGATYKVGGSPLTPADMASHDLILRRLGLLTPDVPVVSEESGHPPHAERRTWRAFWLVDPLDGTKEFVKRNGEFTINIGLVQDGRPVLGVVHAPALELTYLAASALGAFKREGRSQPARICVGDYRQAPLKVVVSRSHTDGALEGFLRRIGPAKRVDMGSSLKICLVAEGAAHLYPRLGPTMEWDTAAAQCVLEAAGGVITDLEGRALTYNKPDLRNPHFIASGDPAFPWRQYFNGSERAAR